MVLVFLEPLEAHPDRVWAVLLGVNLGPTLWVTGALSTLLWQSTMGNLGHPVRARHYARSGWRVGPARDRRRARGLARAALTAAGRRTDRSGDDEHLGPGVAGGGGEERRAVEERGDQVGDAPVGGCS